MHGGIFLAVAIFAGILGFGFVGGIAATVAKVLLLIFFGLFVLMQVSDRHAIR